MRRFVLLFTITLLFTATAVAPAEGAKRKVPFGFFGAVFSPELANPRLLSDATLEQQTALMARSGVESVRITFAWYDLEPTPGAYDLTALDRIVSATSRHGIKVLVNVTATPRWISERPNSNEFWRFPPQDPDAFAELMRRLVARYGPTGTLWAENPTLPRVPVRQWQVWNEQTAPWHWEPRPWARGYTRLLKAAYRAIHGVDRRAQVIAGSLVAARASYPPADGARDLYRAGAKRYFDALAVHPFTNNRRSVRLTVKQTAQLIQRVRAQMRKRKDARKPLLITELTWPASAGKVPRGARFGLETTPRGQAKRLKAVYGRLAKERRKLGVKQVYWYTWATQYDRDAPESVMTFRYSGLTRVRNGAFTPLRILRTYRSVAAKYQGCRKAEDARRCR